MVYQSKPKEAAFWITNISNKNVTLRDLSLNIKKYSSLNLFSKNFHYTPEQILKSVREGSIFSKRNVIKVREVEPDPIKGRIIYVSDQPKIGMQLRSNVVLEEKEYEELKVSEEKFAEEESDFLEIDTTPAIKR